MIPPWSPSLSSLASLPIFSPSLLFHVVPVHEGGPGGMGRLVSLALFLCRSQAEVVMVGGPVSYRCLRKRKTLPSLGGKKSPQKNTVPLPIHPLTYQALIWK